MKSFSVRLLLSLCLVLQLLVPATAQKPSALKVMEDNIRAELGFLASDAMQGRGSGTIFERIAAEYIGTQFRQFGIEPAGDTESSGSKSFVQRVPMESAKFTEAPTLTVTSGSNAQKWTFGHDFLTTFLRVPKVSGELQVIEADGTPAKGAVVVVKLPEGADQQRRQDLLRKARGAQASGLILLESDASRRTREAGQAPPPTLGTRVKGETATDVAFASLSVSKAVFDQLLSLPAGSTVELGGPVETSETGATWNAVGVLKGSDPKLASEVIMLSAHLDHLGVNESAPGDKIFNGADDDASGCVAVLELARALAAGKRPKRTVYFVCFGSEERGGYGARYFISNSPVPLTQIVADVTFEMLGRPDAKVAANTLWLTGYERSNLGPELAKQGALLVQDPHPEQNFFQRSDNYTLALRGVVAHTVSSFGLHEDYHRASDEVSKVDFPFMTRSIHSMIKPISWLANNTFKPAWLPGMAPAR
jgi:aminopeptidase YwaD